MGTRSGSGKLFIEHWDQLAMIWGGCPSVTRIEGAVVSLAEQNTQNFSDNEIESPTAEIEETSETPETPEEEPPTNVNAKKKNENCSNGDGPQKMKDNKRLKLERPLSALQRDQVMVRIAREELEVKKRNADILEQSAKGMEKMVETMAQSLNSFGPHLGNGLTLLAQSLATPPSQQYQAPTYQLQQHHVAPFTPHEMPQFSTPFRDMLNDPNIGSEQQNHSG